MSESKPHSNPNAISEAVRRNGYCGEVSDDGEFVCIKDMGHADAHGDERWQRDDRGFSEEKCIRCGWIMGQPALNCQNDDTPHRFPSQQRLEEQVQTAQEELEAIRDLAITRGYKLDDLKEQLATLQSVLVEIRDTGWIGEDYDGNDAAAEHMRKLAREALNPAISPEVSEPDAEGGVEAAYGRGAASLISPPGSETSDSAPASEPHDQRKEATSGPK